MFLTLLLIQKKSLFLYKSISVSHLHRILYRLYIKLKNRVDPKPPISEQERICFSLSIRVLKLKNTTLSISPVSKKMIISNDTRNIHIVIDGRNFHVSSKYYGYIVFMENNDFMEEILRNFNEILENRNSEKEKEIQRNITHSLSNILSELE